MKISGIGFVYMIANPNGKLYVGSSEDVDYRWSDYRKLRCKKQHKLYRSLLKYGVENHIFEIVWAGELSEMYKYETLIGWGFNVLEREIGLNLALPKLGSIWSSISEELRIKKSKIMFGKRCADTTKLKISISNSGQKRSESSRLNMSNVQKGKRKSKDHCLKLSKANFGKKHSSESYLKQSNTNLKTVYQYSKQKEFIKEWKGLITVALQLNLSAKAISHCCQDFKRSSGGFKWSYMKY